MAHLGSTHCNECCSPTECRLSAAYKSFGGLVRYPRPLATRLLLALPVLPCCNRLGASFGTAFADIAGWSLSCFAGCVSCMHVCPGRAVVDRLYAFRVARDWPPFCKLVCGYAGLSMSDLACYSDTTFVNSAAVLIPPAYCFPKLSLFCRLQRKFSAAVDYRVVSTVPAHVLSTSCQERFLASATKPCRLLEAQVSVRFSSKPCRRFHQSTVAVSAAVASSKVSQQGGVSRRPPVNGRDQAQQCNQG